jgi:hypothetical protein
MSLRVNDELLNCAAVSTQGAIDFHKWIGDSDLKVAKLYNILPVDEKDDQAGRTAATNPTLHLGVHQPYRRATKQPSRSRSISARLACPGRAYPGACRCRARPARRTDPSCAFDGPASRKSFVGPACLDCLP